MPDAAELLSRLVEIAAEAGQRVVEIRARPSVMATKGDGSPLTEADLAADAIIADGLARHAARDPGGVGGRRRPHRSARWRAPSCWWTRSTARANSSGRPASSPSTSR